MRGDGENKRLFLIEKDLAPKASSHALVKPAGILNFWNSLFEDEHFIPTSLLIVFLAAMRGD
jgi:hypothetical protein